MPQELPPWAQLLCRLRLHHWNTIKDTGIHHYDVCQRCGKRRIIKPITPFELFVGRRIRGYQPIDRHWLATWEWMVIRPPRGIRSAVVPPTKDDV